MDDDVRARLKALEMTDYLFFTALAELEPASAAQLLSRLRQWAHGQQDDVQAVLVPLIAQRQGFLDEELRRQAATPEPVRR